MKYYKVYKMVLAKNIKDVLKKEKEAEVLEILYLCDEEKKSGY